MVYSIKDNHNIFVKKSCNAVLKALFINYNHTIPIYVQLQAVKSPYDPSKPVLPAFLPDPKDGALYMMGASLEDPLQKLPWTIPQLVGAPVNFL